MTTNCPVCDRPRIRPEDSGTPYDPGRCPVWHGVLPQDFGWLTPGGDVWFNDDPDWWPARDCEAHRVNWRERALAAEAVNTWGRKLAEMPEHPLQRGTGEGGERAWICGSDAAGYHFALTRGEAVGRAHRAWKEINPC